ncbi:MAG: DUF5658 family protein [Vicinamibacteria bacterium]
MARSRTTYTGPDRRQRPTPFLSRYTFWGRRRVNVHPSSPTQNYYVDRIHRRYLFFLFLILGLSLLDGLFTLYHHVYNKLPEVNPILAAALSRGHWAFITLKISLTLIGATILVLHQHFSRVLLVIYAIAAAFILLDVVHAGFLILSLFSGSAIVAIQ